MLTKSQTKKLEILRELDKRNTKTNIKDSLLYFVKYFFQKNHNREFIVGEHHLLIIDRLEKVFRGEIKNLIINIAPRYGKTELAVKNFIAYCLSQNPKCRFIHLSYSNDLALDNSEEIKDFVQGDEFKRLYPEIEIKKDSKSKKKWYTTTGGGVYATAAGGQVTGFGAGRVDEEDEIEDFIDETNPQVFGGAIIIDDPIKPDDVFSDIKRERINQRFDSTIRSRVNSRNTPIIIIMQRLHIYDLCGYLLENEPNDWDVLKLPVTKEDGAALWPFKHNINELIKLKSKTPETYRTQYMQEPAIIGGNLIKSEWLPILNERELPFNPRFIPVHFVIDGAFTDKEENDQSGILSYYVYQGNIYIKKAIGVHYELNELLQFFTGFAYKEGYKPNSFVKVEAKASGQPIISMLRSYKYGSMNATSIRNKFVMMGKMLRVQNSLPTLASGKVVLINGAWIPSFIDEVEAFPNGRFDDLVDCLTYTIHEEIISKLTKSGVTYRMD